MLSKLLTAILIAGSILFPAHAEERLPDLRAQFPDGSYLILQDEKCADERVEAFVAEQLAAAPKEDIGDMTAEKYFAAMFKAEGIVDPARPTITHGCGYIRPDFRVFFTDGVGYAVIPLQLFVPVDGKSNM